tara:strand:- start:105 stop:476 length:372 start_codon:yes stop_codon:yes gene_type:complete
MEIKDIKHKYKLKFRGGFSFTEFRDRLPDFKHIPFSERMDMGLRSNQYSKLCKQKLCRRKGVYFLYNLDDDLVYIGASHNIGQRCYNRIEGKVIMYITDYNPFFIEEQLIRNYKPKYNVQYCK